MKNFHHWILASIAIVGLSITSVLFTQAQQTANGKIELEITEGQSCCVYGTAVNFGEKTVSFGITEFSGDFLSYHGTTTWGCKDMIGTQTGRAMYISMSGDMKNGSGNKIGAENVRISFDNPNIVGGNCIYSQTGKVDANLSGQVPLIEKIRTGSNYGKICELTTTNVKLKVVTNPGQAPGTYAGTLVVDLPNFVTNTCDGILLGTFYDAETDGLSYVGNMGSAGTTSNSGSFEYKPGEQITFKLGNVTLGNAVTPATNGSVFVTDLFGLARTEVTDANVIKVGKLLQGVDTDNNPDNGIEISGPIAAQFTENSNVTALNVDTKLTTLGKTVRTAKQVVQHLEDTAVNKLNEDVNVGYSSIERIPGLSSYQEAKIIVDSGNNLYIAGSFQHEEYIPGLVSFGSTELYNNGQSSDVYVGKKNSSGDWLWAIKGGGSDNNDSDNIYDITIDAAKNIYVVGSFRGTGEFGSTTLYSQYDAPFVAKINNNGNWGWVITGGYEIRQIAVDNVGNSYVAGMYYSTGVFGSIILPSEGEYSSSYFIGKIDNNGNWLRVKKMDTTISKINIDIQGNIYVVGAFNGKATFGVITLNSISSDAFVAKIDGFGNWVRAAQSEVINIDYYLNVNGSIVDNQGNTYLVGTYGGYGVEVHYGDAILTGDGGGYDGFIAKIDSNGNRVTAKKGIGGIDLAIDKNGFIYSAVIFEGSVSLGTTQFTNRWSSFPSYNDIVGYLVKLTPSIEPVSAILFEGIGISSIAVDNSDSVYIVGAMSEVNLSLGNIVLTGSWNSTLLYKMPFRDKENTLQYQTTPPEIQA